MACAPFFFERRRSLDAHARFPADGAAHGDQGMAVFLFVLIFGRATLQGPRQLSQCRTNRLRFLLRRSRQAHALLAIRLRSFQQQRFKGDVVKLVQPAGIRIAADPFSRVY